MREAVASWEKCMLMNQRVNIAITAGAGPEGLLIEMSRGNENFQFQGVDVHSGDMTCNSSVQLKSTNGNSTYTATKNTNVDITDSKILSLTCTRKARQEAPGKFDFPPMAFSVVTDRGSLFLNLPDDKTGADYLSQWTAEKTELNTKINVLNSRQSRSWIACNGGQGVHQQDVNNPSCPANTVTGEARNFIYPGGGKWSGMEMRNVFNFNTLSVKVI